VARASGRPVPVNKSIVGEAVFTHEAGIHVDGLLKQRANYQGFDPDELGRVHRLVLGKHSGSHGVIRAYAELGILVGELQAQAILTCIRRFAVARKRSPGNEELRQFYWETASRSGAAVDM
jgi:Isopropylmalate/homocitrate/citramalate synthases